MSTLTIPNTISAGQDATAAPLQENFTAISTWANGNVGTTNIANDAITTAKILNANVTAAKLATDITAPTEHVVGAAGEPAFSGAWGVFGAGYAAPSFRKDITGKVTLSGVVSAGVAGTSAFTLPAGYRPAANEIFGVNVYGGSGTVTVNTDGTVVCSKYEYTSLSGVSFYAA